MKFSFTFLLTLCICYQISVAQEVWDLETCIRYARENSLQVQQSEFQVENSEINLKQARQGRYPNLNFNSSLSWNFGRTIDPTTNEFLTTTFLSNGFGLNSGFMLYRGGQINNSIKQAKKNLQASELDVQQNMDDIALNVASAFLNVLFAEENLENARFTLELSEKQLEQIEKLIAAGARPRNELLDLQAQVSLNEQELVASESNLTISYLNLKQFMNLEPDYPLAIQRPPENLPLETDPDQISFREVYNEALSRQPMIEAASRRLESAELGVKIARGTLLPSLSAGVNLSTNYSNQGLQIDGFESQVIEQDVIVEELEPFIGTDRISIGQEVEVPITSETPYFTQLDENIGYGFGFSLSVPLYNNFANKAAVQRAEIGVLTTENQNAQLLQNLKAAVQQALTDAKSAKKQLVAANRSFEAQQAAYNNAEKRFDLGAISIYDFINAKNTLDGARIGQIIAKYDYLFKMKVLDYYRGRPLKLN